MRNAGTERDELDLPMLRLGGRELYYSWRFMLNKDFGFSSNRIVLGQVRGTVQLCSACFFFLFFWKILFFFWKMKNISSLTLY